MQVYKFANVTDYLQSAERGKLSIKERDFYGTDTLAEALQLARRGWPDGAKQARQIAAQLKESFQPKMTMSGTWRKTRTGGAVRVPTYLQGRPDCFLTYKRVHETKFVHVVYVGSTSGGISTESMIKKGVILAAIVDLLETHGVRVKLDLAYGTEYGWDIKTELYVTLKEHNESLELDRIVFFTAHPAALRQIKFNFYDTVRNVLHGVGTGMGAPMDVSDQGDIYFTHQHMRQANVWKSPESTFQYVKEQLKGIEL